MFISTTMKHISNRLAADASVVFSCEVNSAEGVKYLVAPINGISYPHTQIEQLNNFMWHYIEELFFNFETIRHFEVCRDVFKFGYATIPDRNKQVEVKITNIIPDVILVVFYPSVTVAKYAAKNEGTIYNMEFDVLKREFKELFPPNLIEMQRVG